MFPKGRAHHRCIAALLFASVGVWTTTGRAVENDPADQSLAKRMRPILSRCVECHAGEDPDGGLDLTTRASALRGGESGMAIHPGDASRSLLYRKVAAGKMPPKHPLGADQVALVRAWVEAGADWETPLSAPAVDAGLWALQSLVRPEVPTVRDPSRAADPIDAFILARLDRSGLEPSPPADRLTLIRRATFDLLGLPPTPEEIDAFLDDRSPIAFDRLIGRLLASPHYGERWGRHWLDVVRFAESNGFEHDKIRDHAWRYRDYVIGSLNADRPYARFVAEQVAGDVLEPTSRESIAATGFLVAGPWDEANQIQKSATMRQRAREEELEDLVSAVGQTFLGLTVNCARCHDHKFDPIRQRDYYRIKAALEGVLHGNRPLPSAAKGVVAYAACPQEPPPTFVLLRGDVEKKGDRVAAGGLSAVRSPSPEFGLPVDAPESLRRRKLAGWLADPANPLTARVMVNRVWHYHFGTGLVATPNDLGRNGERPSHPELLDWLAADFLAHGTSLKTLHRRIMLSNTYRQSSRYDARAAAVDADDRLLWRYPARRLEAEAIRDAMLAASGLLNPQMAGPSFRPFTLTVFNSNFYTLADFSGPVYDRRTVYRININSAKDPLLETLDCPDPSVKAPRRAVTTTPLQALGLMNDPFVLRQARRWPIGRGPRAATRPPRRSIGSIASRSAGRRESPNAGGPSTLCARPAWRSWPGPSSTRASSCMSGRSP